MTLYKQLMFQYIVIDCGPDSNVPVIFSYFKAVGFINCVCMMSFASAGHELPANSNIINNNLPCL